MNNPVLYVTPDFEGILVKLRSIQPSLRSAEARVAEWILDKPHEIIHLSITELAEKCNVAEATIVRLCKKLGYSGFQEVKISLARDLVEPIKSIHEEVLPTDDFRTMATKVFHSAMQSLSDTLKILDYTELERAIRTIAKARKTDFYGVAGSSFVALDAHHKMFKSGLLSASYNDPHMQIISASFLTNQDVAVGISHSGSTKDTIESLKVAKKAGATTICITSFMKSPITKVADIKLVVAARETTFRSEAMAARIAQLCLIDLIIVGVSMLRQQESLVAIDKMRRGIALKRY
ncbi:MurR/RpiR family transcriptional regulator [Moorella sulfitireducens]|uniref:MurR/RpiR family transcriptional regulator n=1 Tax=Neomoorella sulfitireducens TaxID=2972948 RepID=UPI0021ABA092|nr:MurR/RpiR family transcriptional regulator [Moorella sulfitireducens]